MKHQQIQLACKRNVIRLVALVAMLAVMACGMILSISAANVAESVTFATDSGIEFDSQTNRWVKTYDGQTAIDPGKVIVKVNNAPVTVEKAEFDSANVADVTCITVTYDGGKTLTLPAAIKPLTLTWKGTATASVVYNTASSSYTDIAVDTANVSLKGVINNQEVTFGQTKVSFVVNGLENVVAYANVVLTGKDAANYTVDPLKVNVTVAPIAIDSITWEGLKSSYTFGDDLTGIKALGNGTIPMIITVTDDSADGCKLVASAPNGLYTVTATNTTQEITFQKKVYNVVLNGAEILDNGDLLNGGMGYQLVVEGANGEFVPTEILSQIVYKYYDANGNEVAKVTKPGVYTVKATMPTVAGIAFNANELEATMTVVRNYIIVSTPDGAIVIVGENGISNSVTATLTIPTEFARKAVRGLKAYKGYALTVNGAAAGEKFSIYLPVAADLIASKHCQGVSVDTLYVYNATEGTKALAKDSYTVTLSEDGSYYIIEGFAPAGEITFMLAPDYKVPFWSSAIGIALIVLIALVLLIVLPIVIGMKLIQLEKSGRNPVISVETEGNVPEVEPVVIPDKIDDPDAIIEDGLDALAETLAEEVPAEEAEAADVDATEAVAEAMDELNAEVAEIDLGNADGALEEMAEQKALDLADEVDAAAEDADVSDEVQQAVADAMAENFNESADATDAIALVEDEEVAPEVAEEVVEEVVEETVEEVVEEAAPEVVEEVVVEEPVAEEAIVAEPAPEAEEAEEEEEESFGGFGSMPLDYIDAMVDAERYAEMLEQERRGEVQLVTRYRRSYLSRLAQSQGNIQDYYNVIKNLLLSYKGVKSRTSWGFESFNVGRTPLAKFNAKTRTLYVYIALSPEELADTKYNFADMSAKKKYAAVPVLLKVKGDRKFKHALELITKLCEEKLQLPKKKNFTEQDYRMPFKTTEELVQDGIVKMMVAAIPVAAPAAEEVVEEAPVEETVVEEAPVEEAVAEEAVVEETPVEEAVAEEAVVEEAPVEEAAAEEAVVEETPVEEAVAEEAVVEEAPVEEAAVEEEAVEETNENA